MNNHELEGRLAAKLKQMDSEGAATFLGSLLQDRKLLRLVLNSLHEGVMVLHPNLDTVFINDAAKDLLSITLKTTRSQATKNIAEIVRDQNVVRLIQKFATEDEGASHDETHFELATNPPRNIAVSCFRIEPESADGERMIVVTVRNREKERLLEIERQKRVQAATLTTLSMGLAHEIKNPLNSMKIHAQILKREMANLSEKPMDMDKAGKITDVLLEEIERLGHVITEFSSAVRPTNPLVEKINITTIAERAYNLMLPEAQESGIMLSHDLDYDLPVMEVDPNQISMAIVNLLKNAFDAVRVANESSTDSHDRKVLLRTVREDSNCVLEVADNGCGITPEAAKKMFDPYFTTKATGTGLGLAIVARIVQEHGGTIEVQSKKDMKTTMRLILPFRGGTARLLGHQLS